MKDRHHLRTVNPPTTLPVNDISRRVALIHAIADDIDAVGDSDVRTDGDRMALVQSRLGEVADAYRFGHKNIDEEWTLLLAAVWAIRESIEREAAR